MSINQPKYISVTLNIYELQKNFSHIHDAIFKFSFKKMFPLTLLYGTQNFERYITLLHKIESELVTQEKFVKKTTPLEHQPEVREYYIKLRKYLQLFAQCILNLSQICQNLHKQASNRTSFSIRNHNRNVKIYQLSLKKLTQQGVSMQKLLSTIQSNANPL